MKMRNIIIAVALASLLLLCSCRTAADMAAARSAANAAAENQANIRQSINSEIEKKLMESPETLTLIKYEILLDSPTVVLAAMRNSKSSDAVFSIATDCRTKSIMSAPSSLSVPAGESVIFELEFTPENVDKGGYFCTIRASSDQGEEVTKTIVVNVE